MEPFTFTGDWAPYIQIPAFNEFRLTYLRDALSKTSAIRQVRLQIEDQATMDPDPFPQQIAAINHLLQHQHIIANKLLLAIFERYPAFENYFDVIQKKGYPSLHSPEPLRNMFEITRAEIKLEQREGFAYVALYGPCSWFENSGYGIGILLHKDRIVSIEEDRYFDEEMKLDGGLCSVKNYSMDYFNEEMPSHKRLYMYSPHPKYGTLKPWQQRNNYEYPYLLILRKQNEDFILEVELGLLSVDHEAGNLESTREYEGVTLLEYACKCENEELVRFILSKKPASLKNCIQHTLYNREMVQLLLDAGADINDVHWLHGTVIARNADALQYLLKNGQFEKKVAEAKSMIEWLIAQGADPYIKGRTGNDAFYAASRLPQPLARELTHFLESSFKNFHPGRRP